MNDKDWWAFITVVVCIAVVLLGVVHCQENEDNRNTSVKVECLKAAHDAKDCLR